MELMTTPPAQLCAAARRSTDQYVIRLFLLHYNADAFSSWLTLSYGLVSGLFSSELVGELATWAFSLPVQWACG